MCLVSSIFWRARPELLTTTSIRASDQGDSPLPDSVGEEGCQQEARPRLSHKLNLRDTKVGVGRVRGSQPEDPEGVDELCPVPKALVEALSILQLP